MRKQEMQRHKAMLEVRALTKRFGGIAAVNQVSFTVGDTGKKGEIVGLIGPNGAGKTTLIDTITGVQKASSGQVFFEGREVTNQHPYQSARSGLARTFQIVHPFQADRQAMQQLEFVGLADQAKRPASSLTLPSRKRLELAKSLAMKPRLLMLDEVNAGLNTGEIDKALVLMRAIAASGITIVIVEHLMKVVFSLCERVLVLHHGELIAQGAPRDVANDTKVVEAYLGHKFAARLATMDSEAK
jgi:branched-chain amino acid transport system ATP-binding protein